MSASSTLLRSLSPPRATCRQARRGIYAIEAMAYLSIATLVLGTTLALVKSQNQVSKQLTSARSIEPLLERWGARFRSDLSTAKSTVVSRGELNAESPSIDSLRIESQDGSVILYSISSHELTRQTSQSGSESSESSVTHTDSVALRDLQLSVEELGALVVYRIEFAPPSQISPNTRRSWASAVRTPTNDRVGSTSSSLETPTR